MQYIEIFKVVKMKNFNRKLLTFTHNLCFGQKKKKKNKNTPVNPSFAIYKNRGMRGYTFQGRVFLMKCECVGCFFTGYFRCRPTPSVSSPPTK